MHLPVDRDDVAFGKSDLASDTQLPSDAPVLEDAETRGLRLNRARVLIGRDGRTRSVAACGGARVFRTDEELIGRRIPEPCDPDRRMDLVDGLDLRCQRSPSRTRLSRHPCPDLRSHASGAHVNGLCKSAYSSIGTTPLQRALSPTLHRQHANRQRGPHVRGAAPRFAIAGLTSCKSGSLRFAHVDGGSRHVASARAPSQTDLRFFLRAS